MRIFRRRRSRHRQARQVRGRFLRLSGIGCGVAFSLLLGLSLLLTGLAYAGLTHDLPPVEMLPRLLSPPDGLLLQPTRLVDRSGEHTLLIFAPDESPRRYLPLSPQNPQHLPQGLADATLAVADPSFWDHPGYTLEGWQNPSLHPTIAQQLASDLLLWNEPPSLRRALRERILAAQITARYGRTQVLEWYLNSANYGHYAYGAEAAARLYFGKSAAELTLAESAVLAAVSQTPSLNPRAAPQAALQRGREVIHLMRLMGLISEQQAAAALAQTLSPLPSAPEAETGSVAPAFLNLVINQLSARFGRARIERGGLLITTTLDYDLQQQAVCATQVYLRQLAGEASDFPDDCPAARSLPAFSSATPPADVSASLLVADPRSGQVLAVVGETLHGQETPFLSAHPPGSLLTPFVYLTGFTRGMAPASLLWDVPGAAEVANPDGTYHGPMRLRLALANDYLVPAAAVLEQVGAANVWRTARSFGLEVDPAADVLGGEAAFTLLEVAAAYAPFAAQGVLYGQPLVGAGLELVTVLKVEGLDHSLWLDWTTPQAQPLVTPGLAYLITHALSDETARWPSLGHPNPFEIGRPAGAKAGWTPDGADAWALGYTPQRIVVAWTGRRGGEGGGLSPRLPAGLWQALMQYASQHLPPDGWAMPAGISMLPVCDPSGLLPSEACPTVVSEVFLQSSEPTHADTLYRVYLINRETGYLATVFTPPELVEERVYMVLPPQARAWAEAAGIPAPPQAYDAIQPVQDNPDAHITAPAMFAEVSGVVQISGTAAGADFAFYRLQVGQGLNPQQWIQVGGDATTPVTNGLLAEWDTSGLSGLYAVQLLVVRGDQHVETAIIQVTVNNP